MRELNRKALVPYTPEQMFALVDDIPRYTEFLPWLSGAEELQRTETERIGRLTVAAIGISGTFTTRNQVTPPTKMEMRLQDGPFKTLEGNWSFEPVSDPQGNVRGTNISLKVRFEFNNRMTEMVLGKIFEISCDKLVNAFTQRARELYGK
jgi:ribosome-associated toxin RatA of RatAB toxin-antitoxin module